MKLSICIYHFTVTRIAERKAPMRELWDFLDFMGDVFVGQITAAKVRKYIASSDFPHYQALREFVEWLSKQDKDGVGPPPDHETELDTLFRRLSDAGSVLFRMFLRVLAP